MCAIYGIFAQYLSVFYKGSFPLYASVARACVRNFSRRAQCKETKGFGAIAITETAIARVYKWSFSDDFRVCKNHTWQRRVVSKPVKQHVERRRIPRGFPLGFLTVQDAHIGNIRQ